MIPIIAILICTDIVPEGTEAWNSVHEWGVVVFEETSTQMCGGIWKNADLYPDFEQIIEMEARAPVVWIHGEPFSHAIFAVFTGDQRVTFTYPVPDRTAPGVAEWNISTSLTPAEPNLYDGPFGWAIDYWRNVESIPLYLESSGITEGFLYYECTVDHEFTGNFFNWSQDGNPVFTGTSVENALFFTPYGVFPVTVRQDEFIPSDFPFGGEIDPQLAPETFYRWANARLMSSEITALWETWEPVFTEEDSYWLVFPIPEEFNNDISTIHLETSDQRNVEYERLFLGAVRLR